MAKKAKITMEHIANKAGVSTNTVSRALSNKPDISSETRESIKKIALALGYSYHSKLANDNIKKQQRTHTVGMVIADNTNPVFSRIVKGAEDVLSQRGYHLILCNTDENYRKEKNAIQLLLERDVDGILITPTQYHKKDISTLTKYHIPFVLMGRHFTELEMDSVVADDKQGAFNAANHLLRLGHRKILFINAPEYISSAKERYEGFAAAFKQNKLEVNNEFIRVCAPKKESAYNTMRSILVEGLNPTAVFAFSDLMMLGIFQAVTEFNLRIPEDISLVGFDDIEFVSLLSPPLTTVYMPKYQLGAESARILLAKIEGQSGIQQLVLPTELKVRTSTRKITE